MSKMLVTATAIAIGLMTATSAFAAMPVGTVQAGGIAAISQSSSGTEAVSWRRHHQRNHLRFFFGHQNHRDYGYSHRPYYGRLDHGFYNNPGFYPNSYFHERHYSHPNIWFSIGF